MAYGYDANSVEIGLNIVDDDFVGNYTEKNLMLNYSYIWTSSMNTEDGLSIVKASLTGKLNSSEEANIAGWVIASDGIKYKFSFNYPTVEEEEEEAPAKKAAKKAVAKGGLQKQTLKVVRF